MICQLHWMLFLHEFQRLRARAPFHFDKLCKRRTCILYRKNQWKISVFRLLRFPQFCFRGGFPCFVPPFFLLKILDFLAAWFTSFGSIFGMIFDGLGSSLAPTNPPEGLPGGILKKNNFWYQLLSMFGYFDDHLGHPKSSQKHSGGSGWYSHFGSKSGFITRRASRTEFQTMLACKMSILEGFY